LIAKFESDTDGHRAASREGNERSGVEPVPAVNESPTAAYLAGDQRGDESAVPADAGGGGDAPSGGALAQPIQAVATLPRMTVYAGGLE
jgi:hypothetical protein